MSRSDALELAVVDATPRDIEDNLVQPRGRIVTKLEPEPGKQSGLPQTQNIIPDSLSPSSKARNIALVITLTGAAFLNTLSVEACVIILPTIGESLDIPAARQQWIVSSYSLTFGCFLLLWGRLADVYGKRLIFIFGSFWVCVTTIVVPFCPSEVSFDLVRGLSGLGAAANVPTAIGILGVTFPPGRAKNYAFSFYSAGAPMGSVIGNILGGVVAQYASWKWVFWILGVLAAAVTVAGHFIIPLPVIHASPAQLKSSIDWLGGVLVTTSLLILLFAMSEGNVVGWLTPWIPSLMIVAVMLLVSFVLWQVYLEKKTTRPPLMMMSIFKNHRVSAAMAIMALFFATFNNYLIFATYFYQEYLGLDAIETTLRFIPTGVVGVLTVLVTAQLLARVPVNFILIWGVLCVGIAALLFAVPISPDTTYWAYGFPAMCLAVLGADTVFPALILLVSQALPAEDQAVGGALINAVGQVARAIGLAIGTAVQVAVQASVVHEKVGETQDHSLVGDSAYLRGLRAAEWFNLAMALAGSVIVVIVLNGRETVGGTRP